MRTKIKNISEKQLDTPLKVCGWVRSVRDQKSFAFVELNDGSTQSNLQIIADVSQIANLTTGCSVSIEGVLTPSPGHKQKWELKATKIDLLGPSSSEDYPLQKKRHSFEFLRTIAHLRPRTNTQGAISRLRSELAFATHSFFHERDFLYIQTPIITASDAEGGGQQFLVTTLDVGHPPRHSDGTVDFTKDFFTRPAYLTVSGQLNAEAMACALSDVYTFGPTFRAENSHTTRHLAEFWMIEPEMAFCDLQGDIECAESYVKHCVSHILKNCAEDLEFCDKFLENGLISRLQQVVSGLFARLTYTEAIEILEQCGKQFEFPVRWGIDLQSEHERYLAEEHCKRPVFLINYPQKIKAFYMRLNEDGKTVAAMDLLVPKIGELIGGSQREERPDLLERKIIDFGLKPDDYWWYRQLRQYGTVPHAGFGLGFERLIQFASGIENIREAIPFPRYPGHADF